MGIPGIIGIVAVGGVAALFGGAMWIGNAFGVKVQHREVRIVSIDRRTGVCIEKKWEPIERLGLVKEEIDDLREHDNGQFSYSLQYQ